MGKARKQYQAAFKSKVALEAIKGVRTVNEIATHYGVHPTQVTQWKKQALEHLRDAFSDGRKRHERAEAELQSELYQQIGQLKVELDWVKKKAGLLGLGQAPFDRAWSSAAEHRAPMSVARAGAGDAVLRAGRRRRDELSADGIDR